MTPGHSALIERLDLIVAELEGLPHVKQTAAEAAAALRDLTEWRGIATAPKDGTQVMMICTDPDAQGFGTRGTPHVVIGNWQDPRPGRGPDNGVWNVPMCDWWIGEHDGVLTHWLPLPSAPNQAKEAGE